MLSDSPAERELFHGTRSADEIYKHGFDRGFAGKNGKRVGVVFSMSLKLHLLLESVEKHEILDDNNSRNSNTRNKSIDW